MQQKQRDQEPTRRTLLTAGVAAGLASNGWAQTPRRAKRVVVIGAGIGGMCSAYELVRRGHDVTVIEASGRAGGHVRTLFDPFADGLYADVGAEHFYYPGYTCYWRYLKEFGLKAIPYPRRDHMVRFFKGQRFAEEDLRRPKVLAEMGFNQTEISFLGGHGWSELPLLYLSKYVDQIGVEADPFAGGKLSELDAMSMGELMKREKASAGALQFFGGSGCALQTIWGAAIKKLRGTAFETKKLFRLEGGNQLMTDAFARRLGPRVRLGCPVTGIALHDSGVTISFQEFGQPRTLTAEYVVSAISLVALRQIPVTPAWPEAKAWVIREMPYTTKTRILFQSRTRFWDTDRMSVNWSQQDPKLNELWAMAEEVKTPRGIMVGGGSPGVTTPAALETFLRLYQGKADIEHVVLHEWARDRWAGMCERATYRPGELSRYWPEVTRPVGRVHFAGAYAAPLSWGMEAALESGNRVAEEIDRA